jgi:hypothetical protein
MKRLQKKTSSTAQNRWKAARSDERWERRADRQMVVFSAVSVMLPSQITHLKDRFAQGDFGCEHERGI